MTRPLHAPRSADRRLPALSGVVLTALLVACSGGDATPAGGSGAPGGGRAAGAPAAGGARLAFQSGLNWLSSGQPDKARAELERAVELDAKMHEAHHELGKLLVRQSYVVVGSGSRDRELLEQGVAHLERALLLAPQSAEYAYWIGRAAHIGEDLEKALEYLDKAIALDPDYGLAYKRKGLVQLDRGELETAAATFERALPLLSDDGGLRFQYGTILENLDRPEDALKAYEEAVVVDATLPGPYGRLANLREQKGDSAGAAEAQKEFKVWKRWERDLNAKRKRVQQRPDDPAALTELGEHYFAAAGYSKPKYSDALQWFAQALKYDPRNPAIHLHCGIAMRELGELQFAVEHLKEASFLAPESLDPRLELIRTCHVADKQEDLEEALAQIEEEAPEDVVAHFQLGRVCAELGLDERARGYLEKAVRLDPVYVPARMALAAFLVEHGESADARVHYEYVLTLAPGNEEARQALDALEAPGEG